MLDKMRYRTNLETLSLKKLNKNNKYVFNNTIVESNNA